MSRRSVFSLWTLRIIRWFSLCCVMVRNVFFFFFLFFFSEIIGPAAAGPAGPAPAPLRRWCCCCGGGGGGASKSSGHFCLANSSKCMLQTKKKTNVQKKVWPIDVHIIFGGGGGGREEAVILFGVVKYKKITTFCAREKNSFYVVFSVVGWMLEIRERQTILKEKAALLDLNLRWQRLPRAKVMGGNITKLLS